MIGGLVFGGEAVQIGEGLSDVRELSVCGEVSVEAEWGREGEDGGLQEEGGASSCEVFEVWRGGGEGEHVGECVQCRTGSCGVSRLDGSGLESVPAASYGETPGCRGFADSNPATAL